MKKEDFIKNAMKDGADKQLALKIYNWYQGTEDYNDEVDEFLYERIWDNMDYSDLKKVPHPDDDVDDIFDLMIEYVEKNYLKEVR